MLPCPVSTRKKFIVVASISHDFQFHFVFEKRTSIIILINFCIHTIFEVFFSFFNRGKYTSPNFRNFDDIFFFSPSFTLNFALIFRCTRPNQTQNNIRYERKKRKLKNTEYRTSIFLASSELITAN